jgi:acyl-CoA reductase-like NAD-dependent aldehyde dehydrogenase
MLASPADRQRALIDSGMVAGVDIAEAMAEQKAWAARPISKRLRVLKQARHLLATRVDVLCAAIPSSLPRSDADTMVAEILPLLEACKFLEREAEPILRVKRLGRRGLPFWLGGIDAKVHRVALGRVLVIGPGNYPLFLPGVQALQALAVGNAVVWKPGNGGRAVAEIFAGAMKEAGLPDGLLRITDETVEAAEHAISAGVDKVFFTGSAAAGKMLLQRLAETLTPCVAELSGCDAVVILPSADVARVVKALAFGMRLNGSSTCMAPRRLMLVSLSPEQRNKIIEELVGAFSTIEGVDLPFSVAKQLDALLQAAIGDGAHLNGRFSQPQQPLLVTNVRPAMAIAQADIFAPLLTVIEVNDEIELLSAMDVCPYALTTSIFGEERHAQSLASQITAGTVLVNDLIVPTADPRVPFGGRKQSGFAVTRGAEGLLEMTAVKVISVRRTGSTRQFEVTGEAHADLFEGMIHASHAATWKDRIPGLRRMIAAGRKLR